MTGLQLILSIAAAFCLPGFGQLYQFNYTKAPDRLELAFKIQVVCAVSIGLSMMGIGLLFSWFVIPIAWLIGFVEAVMWALRQPQGAPATRSFAVLLALSGLLGGSALEAAPVAPATAEAAQLTRCGCGCKTCGDGKCAKRGSPCCTLCACAITPAEETFDPMPSVKPAATAKAKATAPACQGSACQNSKAGTVRQPLRGRLMPRRGGWFRGGCRGCG